MQECVVGTFCEDVVMMISWWGAWRLEGSYRYILRNKGSTLTLSDTGPMFLLYMLQVASVNVRILLHLCTYCGIGIRQLANHTSQQLAHPISAHKVHSIIRKSEAWSKSA